MNFSYIILFFYLVYVVDKDLSFRILIGEEWKILFILVNVDKLMINIKYNVILY